MFFADPVAADVQQQISAKVTLVSKILWPALATLVPAAITAGFQWVQNHSRNRRSAELTDRIAKLAKNIAELPPVPLTDPAPAITPQSALTVELESAIHELTGLQTKAPHSFATVTTITAKLRSAFLLYRPKGFLAWCLHLAFYCYLVAFLFVMIIGATPDQTSNVTSATSTSDFLSGLFTYLTIFGILGIPPMIIRYFAARIHRKQCAAAQAIHIPGPVIDTPNGAVPVSTT